MNMYMHHIGDFDKATRHLSRVERSIYSDLMDMYYDTEKQIPLDLEFVCRKVMARSNEESTAVEQVLNEFFTKNEEGWFNSRCDDVINKYHANNNQRSTAGKASAAARSQRRIQQIKGKSTTVERPLESVSTNQKPETINHKPLSVPKGTGATAPTDKSPSDMSRDELWPVAKSLLSEQGMPLKQCGSFVGRLVQQYTAEVVVEVVRAAVVERPVNVQEFLVGGCRSRVGGRSLKKSTMSGLLPSNSPRIPMADDPDNVPAWMRDRDPAHV